MRSMTRVECLRASSLNPSYKGEASGQHAHGIGGLHTKHRIVLRVLKDHMLCHHSEHGVVHPWSVVRMKL